MPSIIGKIEKLQQKAENISLYIAAIITLFLMVFITADVIMRKLGSPILGSYEIVETLNAALVFLGVAYVQKVKGHIFIEVATNKLSDKIQSALNSFGYVVGIGVCSFMTWQSALFAWDSLLIMEYASGIVNVPVWPSKVIVAFGLGLITLRLIWDLIFYVFPKTQNNPNNLEKKTEIKTPYEKGEGV